MTDAFSQIIQELSQTLQIPLHPDKFNAVSLQIQSCVIQLELSTDQENLFLFCKIKEIPPGKFLENVLTEALKVNGLPDPRAGIFGFIAKDNFLSLHQSFPIKFLNGDFLASFLASFVELADSWQQALTNGQIPAQIAQGKPFQGMRI